MFDTQLLGTVYIKERKYDIAEAKFSFSKEIAKKISPEDEYLQTMFLGGIKYRKGKMDSTLQILCPIIDKLHPIDRNNALVFLAKAYLRTGIFDSAYLYGKELAFGSKSYNKATGFEILLSPELKNFIPADSLYIYITKYRGVLEHSLNQNGSQEALMQNALYNYQIHEREKIKAERWKNTLIRGIMSAVVIISLLVIAVLYLKNRNQKNLLRLHKALENVEELKKSLVKINKLNQQNFVAQSVQPNAESCKLIDVSERERCVELRERLKNELLELQRESGSENQVSPIIYKSEAYSEVQEYIKKGKVIPESNLLWRKLEESVIDSSREFKYRLNLLTGGKIKTQDYHVALLIKCGISPTNISILIGRAKGTVSYRREALCEKVFGEKYGVKVIDDVIRLL